MVLSASAKDTEKGALPTTVLRARTVAILVDPNAGVSLSDPQANQVAQRDVEAAIQQWGRFQTVLSTQGADLLIVVRRGHGKLVDETVRDPRQNSRPGSVTRTDDSLSLGGQHGTPAHPVPGTGQDAHSSVSPSMEVGGTVDTFVVYENKEDDPLGAPAVWRYEGKDGLKPHTVPAVEQFRKALVVADKIAAKHP